MQTKQGATVLALLAALLYAINILFSKILLSHIGPTMIAATVLLIKDTIGLQHTHPHTHTHTDLTGHEHAHAV